MATSGTEKDKNKNHAQIKSVVQKTEKTRQMSRQTCSRFGFLGQSIMVCVCVCFVGQLSGYKLGINTTLSRKLLHF
jgi:uncharacterized membrane protein